jgi:hypothetical protein
MRELSAARVRGCVSAGAFPWPALVARGERMDSDDCSWRPGRRPEPGGPVGSMKLQKLAHYSQAWSLVCDERPLFSDGDSV